MAWFNVHDHMWAHPKFIVLSAEATRLWVRAGAWCSGQLTDGYIPHAVLPLLGKRQAAVELVKHRLWEVTDGGYQFHDWADWQRTREQVEADRAAAKERQRKWRESRSGAADRRPKPKAAKNNTPDRSVDEVLAYLDDRINKEQEK